MRKIIRIGPRGGKIVSDKGGNVEYQHRVALGSPEHRATTTPRPRAHLEYPLDLAVDATLDECRKAIFDDSMKDRRETALVHDGKGPIFAKKGSALSVDIKKKDLASWRGKGLLIMHTHTTGSSVSAQDFMVLFAGQLASLEAIALTKLDGKANTDHHSAYRLSISEGKLTSAGKQAFKDWESSIDALDAIYAGMVLPEHDSGPGTREEKKRAFAESTRERARRAAKLFGVDYEEHNIERGGNT